jgi:putative ABC transport system ATP-binding protein
MSTSTLSEKAAEHSTLQFIDTGKTYGAGELAVHALRSVNLTIPGGEFVVILGPSGSGKTTLLNIAGGIESPSSGQVILDGRDISQLDRDELTAVRRDHVGFVFQFFNLLPTLTALENVELIASLRSDLPENRSADVLRQLGMGDRLDHFPGALSGGEQQRVAIARAIVKDPELILCDEPTGALDLETGLQVLGMLRQINRERGCTILLVTHNSAISTMADRVIKLRSGAIVDDSINASPLEPEKVRW